MKRSFATQAWFVWLLSAAFLTLYLRNPLYLVIILLASRLVLRTCGINETAIKLSFWRLALVILAFSVLFNLLLVHVGQTVLVELPRDLWLVGGPLTLEATIYGVMNALVLITLLAVFLTFNALVPASELISNIPRALANVGIVILIAVTYVPETMQQLERVREAQALRGHRISGLRDWRPIVIPLLIGGLERSMNLAETMVARGFGETSAEHLPLRTRLFLIGGLILLFSGWLLSFRTAPAGWALVLGGSALLIAGFVGQGRHVRRTRYQTNHWEARDWLLVGVSMLPLILVILPISAINQESLIYSPYPLAGIPPFDPFIGLALAMLATPALLVEI